MTEKKEVWRVLGGIINTVGVLAALAALGVIAWYVALAAHLVSRVPSGFFAA
jgi:hypothetical protein